MELRPSEDQQALIDAVAALYAKESSPERVRAAEPLGFDQHLWARLCEVGVVAMAVGEDHGGWGAGLVELALVAEQHGRALGAAPLIEVQVAARFLARSGLAPELLAETLDARALPVLSLRPARDGVVPLVPGGAVATHVIALDGESLVLAQPTDADRVVPENLGAAPLADVTLVTATELGSASEVQAALEGARTDWYVLSAAALAGMARRSVEIGVEYTRERHAFGRPIGSFQAISHRLADSATAAQGAELLAREAAWAEAAEPGRLGVLAPMAFAFAAEAARDASHRSLHFHGGYGFMLEYDIQLYWRRARAWAASVTSPTDAYREAGRRRLAGEDRRSPTPPPGAPSEGLDFRLGAGTEDLRTAMREFLAENMTEELEERIYRNGTSNDPEFTARLLERGWVAPQWPEELGGQGMDPIEALVLHEEMRLADAPTYGIGTTNISATAIRAAGSEELQREILPRALGGQIVIVLGFTEPEAGSDLAAVTTRAARDGDDWVVNGQKMFTTNAQVGDYVFMLARTDPGSSKHEGLTMFLVPLDQPGVEVQAVYTLSGERTNITFYNDARVPDRLRIGEVDQGWSTLHAALAAEHAAGFGSGIERLLTAAQTWAVDAVSDDGLPRRDDPDVHLALGRAATSLEVARLLHRRCAWFRVIGIEDHAAGPMSKLFSSEALEARAEEIAEVVGPDVLRSYFDPSAPARGVVEHMWRFSLGTTIYGGTSEVHRNMIAQRGLGLPR